MQKRRKGESQSLYLMKKRNDDDNEVAGPVMCPISKIEQKVPNMVQSYSKRKELAPKSKFWWLVLGGGRYEG
jgi:hypothetical protein